MVLRSAQVWRWIVITLLITLSAPALISQPSTRTNIRPGAKFKTAFAHVNDGKKKGLSREQRAREAEIWHELNRRRLAETHPLGAEALTADFSNQDINDISVIQDDGRVVLPVNLFDLSGRAVQFTPSGSGYTIAAAAAAFDNNIGTKLDLTVAPAVNPKIALDPNVEPGDDAYILKDLGFNFSYFGASFSNVAISSNGNLTFFPPPSPSLPQDALDLGAVSSIASLGEFQLGLPRIAPYWHDLDARAARTTGGAGVFLRQLPDRLMVTWNNIRDFP